jgi:hypothetical protein
MVGEGDVDNQYQSVLANQGIRSHIHFHGKPWNIWPYYLDSWGIGCRSPMSISSGGARLTSHIHFHQNSLNGWSHFLQMAGEEDVDPILICSGGSKQISHIHFHWKSLETAEEEDLDSPYPYPPEAQGRHPISISTGNP